MVNPRTASPSPALLLRTTLRHSWRNLHEQEGGRDGEDERAGGSDAGGARGKTVLAGGRIRGEGATGADAARDGRDLVALLDGGSLGLVGLERAGRVGGGAAQVVSYETLSVPSE